LGFDLRRALRTLKPQKRTRRLERRPDSQLFWAIEEPPIGGPILLDTCVYIDVLRGRSSASADELLTYRTCHHSCVCLAELTHLFGALDPAHPGTKSVLEIIGKTISDIPGHRLHAPDSETWALAGMLAGALARLRAMPMGEGRKRRFLNDALIALQAQALGAAVLTGNIRDFDYLSQLLPNLRVVNYRREGEAAA